jgi:plastocyanin
MFLSFPEYSFLKKDDLMTRSVMSVVVFLGCTGILAVFVVIGGCTGTGADYGNTPKPVTQGLVSDSPLSTQNVTIELSASKMAFNQSTITVPAGSSVIVNLHNQETAGSSQVTGIAHNFAVYDSPAAKTTIFKGDIITGGQNTTYRFTAPAKPGTYFFRCDVHPGIMTGQFIVR